MTLVNSSFFGGTGDQFGSGISIQDGAVYISGVANNGNEYTSSPAESFVLRYAQPPGTQPVWSHSVKSGTSLLGIATTDEGVYATGTSFYLTTDNVGGKERKSILLKLSSDGTAGTGPEGSLWKAATNFYSYSGDEMFYTAATSTEGSSKVIYAAGNGQPEWCCGTFLIAKYDTSGNLLSKYTESKDVASFSEGKSSVVLNGNVYSAGFTTDSSGHHRAVVWKFDKDLNQIWRKRADDIDGTLRGITAFKGALYASGCASGGNCYPSSTNEKYDFLVQKYDESGNLIWSNVSGGSMEDVLTGIVGVGDHLFAVGYTRSAGSGGSDIVVIEIDPATGNTISTTYFGGANDERASGAATDGKDLYVVGESRSSAQGGNEVGQNDIVLLRYNMIVPGTITTSTATPTLTVTPTVTVSAPPATTSSPPLATSLPVKEGKFRVGPSVTLRPVTDVIEANQDGIVELFMNNPSLNDVTLNVDARVSVPSGIHVYGQSFGEAAGAGVVAGTFSVPPGTSRTIIVVIKADKSARIGSHTIQFTGLYYPDENKDNYQPLSLTYSVTVKEPSKKPEEPPKEAQATATPSKIPGFGVVLAIFGVFAIARLLSRK